MALTNCRECGASISSQADRCPQCGAMTRTGSIPALVVAGIVIALAVWFLA